MNEDEISDLSFRQLQNACRQANISGKGSTEILRKRLREFHEQKSDDRPTKHQKSPADDLVCPITLDLPWEPVIAEDGRIYERLAIEEHFRSKRHGELRSPMTNEPMGRKLLPALQTKSLIETLIDFGVITGELAEKWKEKAREKQAMNELIQRAQSGDEDAMCHVGYYYYSGECGFPKDHAKAVDWYQKGREAGSIRATANLGCMFLQGKGVEENYSVGLFYTTLAAEEGCDGACYNRGAGFAKGRWGLPQNPPEAERWLQKFLSGDCKYQICSDEEFERLVVEARRLLASLPLARADG